MDSRFWMWFLEQVNTEQDPITREQIERFCRSPDGPILPNNCLSIERLPEIFWQDDAEEARDASPGYGFDPTYHPYRLRKSPLGQRPYELITQGLRGEVSPSSARWHASLAGWLSDGTPVVFAREIVMHLPSTSAADKDRLDAERDAGIRVGMQMAHLRRGMRNVSVLADDTLMWLEWNSHNDGTFRIMRDGNVVVARTVRNYTRFLQLPGTDKILGIWKNPGGGCGIGWIGDESCCSIPGHVLDVIVNENRTVTLLGTLPGSQEIRAYAFDPDTVETERPGRLRRITDYVGGYREYPGGHSYDYIQRSRHGFQRWMTYRPVGGLKPQPSFAAVSGRFEKDGRLCYYGISDRHLCLMELPGNID